MVARAHLYAPVVDAESVSELLNNCKSPYFSTKNVIQSGVAVSCPSRAHAANERILAGYIAAGVKNRLNIGKTGEHALGRAPPVLSEVLR